MNTIYERRPEGLFIGRTTHYPCPMHVHAMAELTVLTRGAATITVDDMAYHLKPGDAVAIFPLVPHSYDELSPDSRGVTAIFPPDIIPEYAGTFHGMQPENPMLPAEKTCGELRDAVARLVDMKMDQNLPMCVAYLHVMMAGILHSLTYRPVYDYSERGLGNRIISYISDHAFEEITLENASRALGISASHLSHFFSERLHTNFRRFINAIRIEKARLLMRDPNLTLTEICDACGYTNMRTFRRAFQQELGCLPSDHLASLRNRVTGE
ncbi:MAG: AraC family transcriptional regulator [Clostridiales bacterium]|nr:helix-turn-helix transcriptional regulator [Clostridia bacterium]MCR5566427.1 AraC family transcriptional regulator [Clostridiales bacterium]